MTAYGGADAEADRMDVADHGRRSAEAVLGASDNAKTSHLKTNPALEPPKLLVSERHNARLKAVEKRERGDLSSLTTVEILLSGILMALPARDHTSFDRAFLRHWRDAIGCAFLNDDCFLKSFL